MLDVLLEIEGIETIQFTPGANPPPTYTQATIPRYRNTLDSGRGLHSLTEPDEVESILAVLPPEGLFLGTFVDIEEAADELLKKAIRLTNDRQRGKTKRGWVIGQARARHPLFPIHSP